MKKIILFIFVFGSLVSCGKLLTRAQVNFHNKSFRLQEFSNGDKKLIFVPMIHVNKPEKFKQIKSKVDSLRFQGYTIFYEDLSIIKKLDSIEIITVYRKFKNVAGSLPTDYFDKKNKQFKSVAVKGFILQTHENTGVNILKDVRADLPMDSLIALYEKEKGEIVLSKCDWDTGLLEKYKCKKTNKHDADFMIETLRNRAISNTILNSKEKKIAIVYGSRHNLELNDYLRQKDSLWKFVKLSSPLK